MTYAKHGSGQKSQHVSKKMQLFQDARALKDYVSVFIEGIPSETAAKFQTYVGLRAPQFWDKASLDVLLSLCRIESQIDLLTKEYDRMTGLPQLDEQSIKLSKTISQSCAGLVTQSTTIAQRLCLTHAMLHGSPTRLVTTNNAAREANQLLQPTDELPSTNAASTSDYEEAKKMFKKALLKAEQHE